MNSAFQSFPGTMAASRLTPQTHTFAQLFKFLCIRNLLTAPQPAPTFSPLLIRACPIQLRHDFLILVVQRCNDFINGLITSTHGHHLYLECLQYGFHLTAKLSRDHFGNPLRSHQLGSSRTSAFRSFHDSCFQWTEHLLSRCRKWQNGHNGQSGCLVSTAWWFRLMWWLFSYFNDIIGFYSNKYSLCKYNEHLFITPIFLQKNNGLMW